MKIGFDGRYAEGNLGGIGKYIKYLLLELDKYGIDCIIFYSKEPKLKIEGKNIKSVILSSPNRYFFEQIALPFAISSEKVNLYHALGNIGIPLFSPVPSVLTVHDIIPLKIKNYFSYTRVPFLSEFSYNFRLRTSIFKASKIITVSSFVKDELIKKLNVSEEKVETIYSGKPDILVPGKVPQQLYGQKYVLNHGGIDIRKNLDNLIKAFAISSLKTREIKLIITGENQKMRGVLENLIMKLGLIDSVIFTGYVDDSTLAAIIKNAEMICYPTLSEGFGFPVLEGFGAGIPVVSSNTSSIPEIAGKAALLVNPNSVSEIANAMEKVLDSPKLRKEMVSKGKEQYNKFSWERAANEYIDLYNNIK